nr:uncharacterized protein LOC113829807 [Penaeus vannamei]
MGIRKHKITPYHPSSNGQVKRVNGTSTKIIKTLAVDNPEKWSQMLPQAVLAYNTAYHRIIKETPFFALRHRDPTFPYKIYAEEMAPWYIIGNYAQEMHVVGKQVFKRCQELIEEEIRRPADRPGSKPSPIEEGDRVYLKAVPKSGVSKKVQPLYTGPYRVTEKVSDVVVHIQRLVDKKLFTVHVDRLKLETSLRERQAQNVGRAYPIHDVESEDPELEELNVAKSPERSQSQNRKLGKEYTNYSPSRRVLNLYCKATRLEIRLSRSMVT